MAERKIRVGLIIEDFNVQAWIYIMLEKIIQSDFAEIVLIANSNINSPGIKKKKPAFSLINLYLKQERKLSKQKKSYTLRPVASIIENIPLINVSITKSNDGSVEIKDDDVNKIEKYEADVLINLDLPYLKGKILNAAVCGVWAYDPMLRFDNNLFLQQIKEDDCSVSVTLKMFTEGFSSGRVLYKSFSAGTIVFNKNINWLYWKAASFIPRKLKELHEDGATVFLDKAKNRIETGSNDTGYKSNFSFLSKHFSRLVKTITGNALQFEQWVLLYCFPQTDQQLPLDISKYREITPPKDRFWADPCVFTVNNRHYIFLEELIYSKKKAHISVMEIDETGNTTQPQLVLEKPYHLSYPFVFKDGDDIYMLPETSGNKTIELYKCNTFPLGWEFKMNLMENIHATDATIHYSNNRYWLFVNIRENEGASDWDELFLFYADDLLTQNWLPHKNNPIVSDVRTARPAGRIFENNGKLYRPSQDCSCTYGYAININEIVTLSETEYAEKRTAAIYPWNKDIVATHTFFNTGALCVIDARKRRRK